MTKRRRTLKVISWACTCERCGHEWEAIGQTAPRACAHCKSRYWDVPRGQLKRGPKAKG